MLSRLAGLISGQAYILLIVAPLLWGGNAVAGRLATADWQPFMITSLRWLCAILILIPFALGPLKRDWPVIRRHALLLFVMGSLGMAAFNMTMYLALHFTTAINVSIEQAAIPAMIMLANFVLLRQRVRSLQIIGLLLTLCGVAVTTTGGQLGQLIDGGLNRGDAIMLLACVFYAGYTYSLRWRPAIHWLSFLSVIGCSAFVVTIPFTLWELSHTAFVMPSAQGWLILLYVTVFPTIISQLCWARGVELIGSNRAGIFINLVPIFGSLLAVLLIGELFRWYHLLGLVMVLSGIALAEKSAN